MKSRFSGRPARLLLPLALGASLLSFGCVAQAQNTANTLFNWKPVRLGAGGFVTGFVSHPLDAQVRYCRTDVGNAYRWDGALGEWVPLLISNIGATQKTGLGMPVDAALAPAGSGVESIAVDPNDKNKVFLSFRSSRSADVAAQYPPVKGKIFLSSDGGRSFAASDFDVDIDPNGEWRTYGERLHFDPANSQLGFYGSKNDGLWATRDGGKTWKHVVENGAPGAKSNVIGVRFAPLTGKPSTIYAVVGNGSVFSSLDGANWENISEGEALDGHAGNSLVDSTGALWVTHKGSPTVWCFEDQNWKQLKVDFGWGQNVQNVAVSPLDANIVWAVGEGMAMSRSQDGGASWIPCGHDPQFADTLGWLPQKIGGWRSNAGLYFDKTGRLWMPQGNEGVLTFEPTNRENADNPPKWNIASQGIEEFVSHDVTIPPGGNPLFAVEDATGFVTTDPSKFVARQFTLQDQLIANGTSVAYCPNAPSFVVSCSSDVNYTGSQKNYSGWSSDGGQTWKRFASVPLDDKNKPMNAAGTIAISRRGDWGLGGDHLAWLPSNGANPFYSTDGGATWNASTGFTSKGYWIFALKQRQLKADPFVADKFYLGGTWGGGMFVSLDGGKSWQEQKGANLPLNAHHGQLETNRLVRNDLWFCDGWEGATAHGLWHSVDGGATFAKVAGIDHAITLALGKGSGAVGAKPYTVYFNGKLAADPQWGIFRSTDGGSAWERIAFYPYGIFDQPTSMAASWDTGEVYVGFNGNSFVVGQEK